MNNDCLMAYRRVSYSLILVLRLLNVFGSCFLFRRRGLSSRVELMLVSSLCSVCVHFSHDPRNIRLPQATARAEYMFEWHLPQARSREVKIYNDYKNTQR